MRVVVCDLQVMVMNHIGIVHQVTSALNGCGLPMGQQLAGVGTSNGSSVLIQLGTDSQLCTPVQDIKPENIMVHLSNGVPILKLGDLNLAEWRAITERGM